MTDILQAVTFEPSTKRALFLAQAERLQCSALASETTLTIIGDKYQLRDVIDRLIESKIKFIRSFQPSLSLLKLTQSN